MNGSAASELKRLLGEGNVRTGSRALSSYFREPVPDGGLTVVTPADEWQLADTAHFCYENDIPIFSVRRRYSNDDLAGRKGVLIDLARMDQIKNIDVRNLTAHVFAGVTFDQLARELAKENQRILYPVSCTSDSVLRSYIDRDILMGSGGYRHLQYSVFHAMLGSGEKWVSGSQQMTDEGHADFREDQGPQFSPFFGASEDIFGIPYYGLVYTYPNREARSLLAFGFDELEPAKDLLYKTSRAEWCFEAFAANDRFLSVLLAGGDAGKVAGIKKKLNPWTVVITMEHHKELVELWERYNKEAAAELGGKLLKGAIPEELETALQKPWNVTNRDFFKGRCEPVFAYQYFKNVGDTFALIDEKVKAAGLKEETGKIVVPTYFGGAAYCEADLYWDPSDEKQAAAGEKAFLGAFEALLDDKAFVDKPVGKVAELLYSRTDPTYVQMIKLFKKTVDPKGLLNPDQLLEGV